jgi:hypothetical protein
LFLLSLSLFLSHFSSVESQTTELKLLLEHRASTSQSIPCTTKRVDRYQNCSLSLAESSSGVAEGESRISKSDTGQERESVTGCGAMQVWESKASTLNETTNNLLGSRKKMRKRVWPADGLLYFTLLGSLLFRDRDNRRVGSAKGRADLGWKKRGGARNLVTVWSRGAIYNRRLSIDRSPEYKLKNDWLADTHISN